MQHHTPLRTPLKLARRLGSAKTGTHHWWMQRLSAVALVPLTLWFVISIALHARSDYYEMLFWVSNPVHAVLLSLLTIGSFYHAVLGLQVVIEDYVHCSVLKIASLVGVKFAALLLGAVCLWSIVKVAV